MLRVCDGFFCSMLIMMPFDDFMIPIFDSQYCLVFAVIQHSSSFTVINDFYMSDQFWKYYTTIVQ